MNRPVYPTIIFHFERRPPLTIEVELRPNDKEGWELYVLLKEIRRMHNSIAAVMPLLESSHLIASNPAIESLRDLLADLPHMAQLEHDFFLRQEESRRVYRNSTYRPSFRGAGKI